VKDIDRILLQQLSRLKAPDCLSVKALGDFLDGRGSTAERYAAETHLRSCPSCTNRLIELQELARLADAGEDPPHALVETVKHFVSPDEVGEEVFIPSQQREAAAAPMTRRVRSPWITPRFLGAVTAAAAGILLAFFGIRTFLPPAPQVRQSSLARNATQEVKENTELRAPAPQVIATLTRVLASPHPLWARLSSVLQKIPATAVMLQAEKTRGATNVEVSKQAAPATVLVVTDQAQGSGALISDRGEVLTNWHVIQGASQAVVVFKPEEGVEIKKELAFTTTPVKLDPLADLALLQIQTPPPALRILRLGNIADVEVGQEVYAIGHPEGEAWTYTTGTVSQIHPGYRWTGTDGQLHEGTVIQTQTASNPGNSGGPLLNDRAELIGVNAFREEKEGINSAVAVDVVKEFLNSPMRLTLPTAPSSSFSSFRTESYGPHFVGVYVKAQIPPPDVWLVYGDTPEQLLYAAASRGTALDTVIRGADPQWVSLTYDIDTNCDGMIDLVGYSSGGDGMIDRYDRPQSLRIADLTTALRDALANGTIPYSQVHVCQ